jgi:hypothetical protein
LKIKASAGGRAASSDGRVMTDRKNGAGAQNAATIYDVISNICWRAVRDEDESPYQIEIAR